MKSSKMFGSLPFDGAMRFMRQTDLELRRDTQEPASPEWFVEHVEASDARENDDTEALERNEGREAYDQITWTLDGAMDMATSASVVHLKCCTARCLHALDKQRPGWIARKRRELQGLLKSRAKAPHVRRVLRALQGGGSRMERGTVGGVPHCAAYMQIFLEVEEVLRDRGACTASRFAFVSKKFFYGNPCKRARNDAARGVDDLRGTSGSLSPLTSLALMTQTNVCCRKDCLGGNVVMGVNAVQHWMDRARSCTSQRGKRAMVRDFHNQFPGICRNAVQLVLGVGTGVIADHRRRARASVIESPEHGLVSHIRANPRPVTREQEALKLFFDTYLAGSPTSERGLAHINSALPVNGEQGFFKAFTRMTPLMEVCFSTFKSNLQKYLRVKGFAGLDRAHVDHNVCPCCKSFKYQRDALKMQRHQINQDAELGGRETREAQLSRISQLEEQLEAKKLAHAERNDMCRSHVVWWQDQAVYARATPVHDNDDENDTNLAPVSRASVPRIAMWHCDGEASRKRPHVRLESTGGGFEGRMQKNVGFTDMVTRATENFFLPDLLRTESTSMLIDMILQRALLCKGEQVLVLPLDCCSSNYNGTLWAFIVYLVDELKWFTAVIILYFMPRHGKGPADKIFGGHKSI